MLKRELVLSFLTICFILECVPTASCISSPPIIYVAGDGSGDYNCFGNSDQVQINQALQFVAKNHAYTTVYLKGPFTYVIDGTILIGSNTILEGDSSAMIKLTDHAGWPSMKPLIQQTNNAGNENITVRGFEVDGNYAGNSEITLGRAYYNIMYFTYCNNIKVYNMYMHDGMGDGLRVNKCTNIQYHNNTIYKLGHDGFYGIGSENIEAWNNNITCRTNSGLRLWNSNKVKFHDNLIDSFFHWSAGGPGIQIEKSDGIMDNIEIYNNVIRNTYGPGMWILTHDTTSTTQDQAKNLHIHNNIFYNTGTNPSITWVGGIIASGFHDTLIENNVFDGCYGTAIAHMFSPDYVPEGGFTTIVRNNIIVNTQKRTKDPAGTGCGIANYLPDTHIFLMEDNCLYNNSAGNYKNCLSTTDLYVYPSVADQKNHDYHLLSAAGRWDENNWVKDKVSSFCIDAGYRYSDYSNEPEPNGNRINIGPDGNTRYASKSGANGSILTFPTANFSSNKTGGYAPLSVQFTDLSKNANEWKWDFGDGTNSIQQNPVHAYSVAGNYTVNLVVSNGNGTDSKSSTITVLTQPMLPVANFTCNVTSGTVPLPVQFTDLSKNTTSRTWYFGDSFNSTQQNPMHIYSAAGNYTVKLTANNTNGTDSKTASITVLQPLLPVANFSTNVTTGTVPLSVQFTDFSKNAVGWIWNFGDGANSAQQNPTHVYSEAGNYNVNLTVSNVNGTNSKLTTIEVHKSIPTITWIEPADITYGTILSSTQLNASVSVPGAFAYTPKAGTLLAAGAHMLNVDFTPSDTVNYSNTSKNITIDVLKSTPIIKWNNPVDIFYGTALSGTQLNATASVPGTFIYIPASGTVLSAGTQTLYADFTPADNANYTGSSKSVSINVQKSIPTITWRNPADIIYGTVLGGSQLNASASVPGTFIYAPAAGTILDAGVHTLNVDFTPDDAANYTISSMNTTINVLEKPIFPVANFSTNVTGGTVPLSVQFNDFSEYATAWNWKFGDGNSSTERNPVHSYSAAGDYTATLTAGNSNGTDSMTRNISAVKEEKISSFSGHINNRLREASPENVFSNSSFLDVGEMKGIGKYRDVIWFNLSEYANDTQINNATFSLFWYYPNSSRLNDTVVEVYRPASAWNSSYVSWNKRNKSIAWNNPGGDWYDNNGVIQGSIPYATFTLKAGDLSNNSYCDFNVTNIVREYASGKYSNTGFLVKARNESDNYVAFYSAQCGNASEVPKLKLVYS